MIEIIPEARGRDRYGAGYFGASRGSRSHGGVDFVRKAGEPVLAFAGGKVTKLGYPYRDHLEYRYVEITDDRGFRCRYFYADPHVSVGDRVVPGGLLGRAQDLERLYPGITPHYHFEVITMSGRKKVYHDPIKYLAGDL